MSATNGSTTAPVTYFQCSCGASGPGNLIDHLKAAHPEQACPDETFVCWNGHTHKVSERAPAQSGDTPR